MKKIGLILFILLMILLIILLIFNNKETVVNEEDKKKNDIQQEIVENNVKENIIEENVEPLEEEYTYSENGNAITPNQNIHIYDEKNNVIGQLIEGEKYLFESESDNQYEIQLENHIGHINKSEVKEISINDYSNDTVKATNDFIQIKANTELYGSSSNNLYYIVGENRRYPIVSSDKSYYYIYIAHNLVKVPKENSKVDKGIPVLMYHHLLHKEENKNFQTSSTIQVKSFEEQMKYMNDNGYETITPKDLELYLSGEKNLSTKSVLITFDDGLKSNKVYAYPILKQYGFNATIFIITSRTKDTPTEFNADSLQFLSKGELKELSDAFNFEGHTHELHAIEDNNKSKVFNNTYEGLIADFEISKTVLPNQKYFAYPFGQYNQTTISALKDNGYTMAFTTKTGKVQKGNAMFELNRIAVHPDTSIKDFAYYLSNEF